MVRYKSGNTSFFHFLMPAIVLVLATLLVRCARQRHFLLIVLFCILHLGMVCAFRSLDVVARYLLPILPYSVFGIFVFLDRIYQDKRWIAVRVVTVLLSAFIILDISFLFKDFYGTINNVVYLFSVFQVKCPYSPDN